MVLGQRLAEARRRAGLAQVELAAEMGDRYDQTMISHVESGRSGLVAEGIAQAARALSVSTDYLLGLTSNATPAAALEARLAEIDDWPASGNEDNGSVLDRYPVEVVEVAAAAGSGAAVLDETPIGRLWFRRSWLRRHTINPVNCNIISVRGDSMDPTLPDGCSILVDRSRRELHTDRIYVLRTDDGLVVKRLVRGQGWVIRSDNPTWPDVAFTEDTDVVGEVRWSAREF